MQNYNKLIVAVVGLVVMLAAEHGLNLSAQQDAIVQILVSVLTAAGVYQVPNKPNPPEGV
jgi:uncharacterized membrane protein (DUF441 family)